MAGSLIAELQEIRMIVSDLRERNALLEKAIIELCNIIGVPMPALPSQATLTPNALSAVPNALSAMPMGSR